MYLRPLDAAKKQLALSNTSVERENFPVSRPFWGKWAEINDAVLLTVNNSSRVTTYIPTNG